MVQGPISSILVTIRPGVRSPKSAFTGLSKRILMKFYGELGCGLETSCLHFGDDPHHYPNPGVRFGSRSGSGKNCHVVNTCRTDALQKPFTNSIMLTFGGGLCSLSTSCNTNIMRRSSCIYLSWWIDIFEMQHFPNVVILRSVVF